MPAAGRLCYEHAQRIVADVDAARAAIADLEAAPRGLMRVSVPVSFGQLHVVPALPEFLRRYPDLEVELIVTDQFSSLVEESVDVAIRIAELADSTLVARRFLVMQRVICASPAYLQHDGEPRRPDELAGHQCLGFRQRAVGEPGRQPDKVWRFQGADGTVDVAVKGRLRSNNGEALVAAAMAGLDQKAN